MGKVKLFFCFYIKPPRLIPCFLPRLSPAARGIPLGGKNCDGPKNLCELRHDSIEFFKKTGRRIFYFQYKNHTAQPASDKHYRSRRDSASAVRVAMRPASTSSAER